MWTHTLNCQCYWRNRTHLSSLSILCLHFSSLAYAFHFIPDQAIRINSLIIKRAEKLCYLWKFPPDTSNSFGEIILEKLFCHPAISQFFLFPLLLLYKSRKLLILFKLTWPLSTFEFNLCLSGLSSYVSMVMSKNVNNRVSKDSPFLFTPEPPITTVRPLISCNTCDFDNFGPTLSILEWKNLCNGNFAFCMENKRTGKAPVINSVLGRFDAFRPGSDQKPVRLPSNLISAKSLGPWNNRLSIILMKPSGLLQLSRFLETIWTINTIRTNECILGDPGADSRVRRKGGTKVFKYGLKSSRVPILTELFPKIQANAGSWLGTKNALYYCAQSENSLSWVPLVSSYTTTIVSITACLDHAPKKCTQSANFQFDIKSLVDFKILSARKLKTLFQNTSLSLQQVFTLASVTSCVTTREFLAELHAQSEALRVGGAP